MLANAPLTAILPVIDMHRAREFYENRLGLKPAGPKPDGSFTYACAGGAVLALMPREGGTKADHTAVSFQVRDIEAKVRALEGAGVAFEDYDLPDRGHQTLRRGLQSGSVAFEDDEPPESRTVHHVCITQTEKCAWFKDTEGNYLCIHEAVA